MSTLNFKKMGRSSKSAKCFIWSARPSRLLGHSRHTHISIVHTYKTNVYGIRIHFFQFKLLWHLSWSWVFVRWLYMVNVYKARSNSPLHIKMRACFDHFNNITPFWILLRANFLIYFKIEYKSPCVCFQYICHPVKFYGSEIGTY